MNKYMSLAVEQALIAASFDEVPIGAVIVKDDEVISFGYNRKNIDNVAIYHAEMLCIMDACKKLNSWYLNDCDIYVTLKPCAMCLNALAEARIRTVFYLLDSNYEKNLSSNLSNIKINCIYDCYNYSDVISNFFREVRK